MTRIIRKEACLIRVIRVIRGQNAFSTFLILIGVLNAQDGFRETDRARFPLLSWRINQKEGVPGEFAWARNLPFGWQFSC
jgi:hypothetical protein